MLSHEKNIALYMCATRKVVFYIDVLSIMAQVVADLIDKNSGHIRASSVCTCCRLLTNRLVELVHTQYHTTRLVLKMKMRMTNF